MLNELIDEIEERLRLIIREEISMALTESKSPSAKNEEPIKMEREKSSVTTAAKTDFPTIFTAQEIAPILNISLQRLYELVRTRKTNGFPVIVLGERQYRFSKEAVLAWLQRDNS